MNVHVYVHAYRYIHVTCMVKTCVLLNVGKKENQNIQTTVIQEP